MNFEPDSYGLSHKLSHEFVSELRQAWDDGDGHPAQILSCATALAERGQHLEYDDDDLAMFHAIAEGCHAVPPLDRWLFFTHKCGRDAEKAICHLERAAAGGDEIATLTLASYLLGFHPRWDPVSRLVDPDPERALKLLRSVTTSEHPFELNELWSRYLLEQPPESLTPEDRRRLDVYAGSNLRVREESLLALARHCASTCSGNDYTADEYRTARALLLRGQRSIYPTVRESCEAQLRNWGLPVPTERTEAKTTASAPATAAEKAVEVVRVTGIVTGIGLTLWVWSIIGIFLMGLAAAINVVSIPILLLIGGLAFVFSKMRGK